MDFRVMYRPVRSWAGVFRRIGCGSVAMRSMVSATILCLAMALLAPGLSSAQATPETAAPAVPADMTATFNEACDVGMLSRVRASLQARSETVPDQLEAAFDRLGDECTRCEFERDRLGRDVILREVNSRLTAPETVPDAGVVSLTAATVDFARTARGHAWEIVAVITRERPDVLLDAVARVSELHPCQAGRIAAAAALANPAQILAIATAAAQAAPQFSATITADLLATGLTTTEELGLTMVEAVSDEANFADLADQIITVTGIVDPGTAETLPVAVAAVFPQLADNLSALLPAAGPAGLGLGTGTLAEVLVIETPEFDDPSPATP